MFTLLPKKYQEILKNQTQTQSDGSMAVILSNNGRGKEKKDIWSWSSSKSILCTNFCVSSGSDASGSVPCPNTQRTPIKNVDELVVRMIPSLTDHLLSIFVEQVRGLILQLRLSQTLLPTNHQLLHM